MAYALAKTARHHWNQQETCQTALQRVSGVLFDRSTVHTPLVEHGLRECSAFGRTSGQAVLSDQVV